MGAAIEERVLECRSDVASIWRLLVDTERLNRATGLGKLALSELDDPSAARYLVRTWSGVLPFEYEERPFEWVELERFSVERIVRRGPLRVLRNEFLMAPTEDRGTRVTVRIGYEARLRVLGPIVRLQVRAFLRRLAAEILAADAEIAEGRAGAFANAPPSVHREGLARASRMLAESTAPGEAEIARQLVEHVEHAPDVEAQRIRPFELAERWGAERRLVLTTCLRGVVSGLLELQWELVCPSCHTSAKIVASLAELGETGSCHFCDIRFGVELDRAVEATFRPAAAVREVDAGPYCIGGPYRTPHVVVQGILAPRAEARLVAPRRPGPYRFFVRGGLRARLTVVEGGAPEARLCVSEESVEPASLSVGPGAALVVDHQGERERHAKIERAEWTRTAATAHELTTIPAFRRQFARELLRPGLTLSVARAAVLFTDLTGSTAMYTTLGDARAFKVVQDHFDLLRAIIEESGGVVVKTIGDAIMASFCEDAAAVRAAVRMHRALVAFRQQHAEWSDAFLKLGLHAGACYVVTANGVLDYFGQSVNVAARLQSCSRAGEIVLSQELAAESEAQGWLDGAPVVERFDAELRGLAAPVRAARVLVDPLGARRTSVRPRASTS